MTVNANTQNVQPLVDDVYFHHKQQQQVFLGSHGQETPGEAQKLITQGKIVYNFRHDGSWHLDRNIEGVPEQNIESGYYDPDFRVRAFKIYNGQTNLFGQIVYDTPASHHAIDSYATGVLQQVWITRLYLGDPSFGNGTPQEEFRVSLIG